MFNAGREDAFRTIIKIDSNFTDLPRRGEYGRQVSMMEKEEERSQMMNLEANLARMDQIKNQMESLRAQMMSIQSILADHSSSLEALKEIIETGEKEALMPIGGSAFLKVEIKDTSFCLLDRGGGIFMDTPLDRAREVIEKRVESLRKTITTIEGTMENLLKSYDEISRSAQEVYARQMSGGTGPQGTF